MSELTRCNFCNLFAIQEYAKRTKRDVIIMESKTSAEILGGGSNVYTVPTGTNLPDKKEDREKYFEAWFWSIPDHCCC